MRSYLENILVDHLIIYTRLSVQIFFYAYSFVCSFVLCHVCGINDKVLV